MEQPQGFVDTQAPNHVCCLHKTIYGLKQALRAWFYRLSTILLDLDFIASLVDTYLFTYYLGSIYIFILILWVTYLSQVQFMEFIMDIILQLQKEFPVKNLGPLRFF